MQLSADVIRNICRLPLGKPLIDPATKKISLTRERLNQQRATKQYKGGITGMARAAEALEARE